MSFPVGIGIVTCSRNDIVAVTIERVQALIREPNAAVVVADDDSAGGTLAIRKLPR